MPLPIQQEFDLNKIAAIQPDTEYVALDEDALDNNFYELHNEELKKCTVTDKTFICLTIFPLKKVRQTPLVPTRVLIVDDPTIPLLPLPQPDPHK